MRAGPGWPRGGAYSLVGLCPLLPPRSLCFVQWQVPGCAALRLHCGPGKEHGPEFVRGKKHFGASSAFEDASLHLSPGFSVIHPYKHLLLFSHFSPFPLPPPYAHCHI